MTGFFSLKLEFVDLSKILGEFVITYTLMYKLTSLFGGKYSRFTVFLQIYRIQLVSVEESVSLSDQMHKISYPFE